MPNARSARLPVAGVVAAALVAVAALLAPPPAAAQSGAVSELKNMITLEGAAPVQLTGYGLVVGLDRTGDRARGRRGAVYTVQSIANMLRRFGVTVDPEVLSSRNAAAVLVTTTMDPFSGSGSQLDVTVSALGDARSLSGGVLLQTPLLDPQTEVRHAVAQGPVLTGAAQAESRGSSVQVNHPNTGRVPNGGIVTVASRVNVEGREVGLILRRPDFTNASKIADAINEVFPSAAEANDAGRVQVTIPGALQNVSQFMAALEGITVQVDAPARVVINERTGTIVAGGDVRINEVMVTSGDLIISTEENRFVSQPNAFADGETVPVAEGEASVEQERAQSVVLPPNTNVGELATALNELGVTARDVISIFQSIDRAQALQAELIIL